MQTIVKDIKSDDGECFDEQVERALAERNAWVQASSSRSQPNVIVTAHHNQQLTPYHQYRSESSNQSKEEELLEMRLADIAQAQHAYTQQAFNMIKDRCFEVIRQKKHTIALLQMENQRLQNNQQNSSPGHNSGGTGESPIQRYSYKDGELRGASNSGQDPHKLREAALDVPHPALPSQPAAPMVNAVKLPQGEAPTIHPGAVDEVPHHRCSVGFDQGPGDFSDSLPHVHFKRSDTRRESIMQVAMKARKTAKLKGATDAKNKAEHDTERPVFIDASAMKERVREAIMRPEYNVMNAYKSNGLWQYLARHPCFENITLGIIALNAGWIWVDTDVNTSPTLIAAHPVFIVAECFFCFYFTVEIMIRFLAFRNKRDCLNDTWFVFDSLLVIMMILETWVMSIVLLVTNKGSNKEDSAGLGNASILRLVRLLRLTRMARMARLLRAVPEMMILIKGILVAVRSVFFTLLMLAIIIYIFGVAFAQLCKDTPLEKLYFANVHIAMGSLLLRGVLPDLYEFVSRVGQEHPLYAVLLLFFILLSSLTVMNMLVGVLVEVVSVVSSVEKEQMTVQFVKTMLLGLLQRTGIDADCNQRISRQEFESLLMQPEAARIIQEVGVDVVGLVDLSDFIFEEDVELSFPEFMEIVLQLRGSNTATVRDIVEMRRFVLHQLTEVTSNLSSTLSSTFSEKVDEVVKKALIVTQVRTNNMGSKVMTPASSTNVNFNGARGDQQPFPNGFSRSTPDGRPMTDGGLIGNGRGRNHSQMSRPQSGNLAGYRPQSGKSNPQPLPAFPDSMWITELSD